MSKKILQGCASDSQTRELNKGGEGMENTKGNGRGGWEGAWIREGSNKREG
jgi:hypothetical protein